MGPHEVRDGVYISDGDTARRTGDEFEHVITLERDADVRDDTDLIDGYGAHEHTTQHVPLRDGQNPQDQFDKAVGVAIKAIDTHEGSVLVHCQAGISRSSTVLITALAHIDDTTFEEAYDEVWEAKPSIAPHPELRKLALNFLGEDGSVYKNPFNDVER